MTPRSSVTLRHFRPELPPWLDAVLGKALHPVPTKRQQVISEFVHDLSAPGASFLRSRRTPLAERDPVLFWKCLSIVLALLVVALVFCIDAGRH